jgi:hypothetical protein
MKLIFLALLILCTSTASQWFPDEKPTRLSINISALLSGPMYSVDLKDGNLEYRVLETGQPGNKTRVIVVRPSKAAWSRFWLELNNTGVYRWRKSYLHPEIMDGTHWSITLEWGDRKFTSEGQNGYPANAQGTPSADPTGNTAAFNQFCLAVAHLTGHEFR